MPTHRNDFIALHRRNLRRWTSLAAMTVACLPALAGARTISTPETGKIALSGNDSLQVTGTGSLSTGGAKAVSISAPTAIAITVDSGGTITSEDDAINAKAVTAGNGTIAIVNNGTIASTVSGQAIDLDDVAAAGVTTTITNGGTISSADGDGVRPGGNATVINSGTIHSDGPVGENADGVDLQGHAGTIDNRAGGLISGKRHGITSDIDVQVLNEAGATILGRNGSGVGSDGTGTVINYGTIIGAYDGSGQGDGDGIDIDHDFHIENYGQIVAAGAGGKDAGLSEGVVTSGSGTLLNAAGASITAVDYAVDLSLCCSASATVINYGTMTGGRYGIVEAGVIDNYNYGTISGGVIGFLVQGDDNDIDLHNEGTIHGDLNGVTLFAGSGQVRIENTGTISGPQFAIHVTPGTTLELSGDGLIDGKLINDGIASVTGGTVTGATVNTGTLAIGGTRLADVSNLSGALTLSGVGAGALDNAAGATVQGTGGTFAAVRNMGTLALRSGAAVAGDVTGAGGTLTFDGTVGGNLVVGAGSTLLANGTGAPTGGSVTVAGQTYRLVAADHAAVAGVAQIEGGTAAVTGALKYGTAYDLLTAAGGVDGRFDALSAPNAYTFLAPELLYTANDVYVVLDRNAISFATAADSANGRATGLALDGLTLASPVVAAAAQLDTAGAHTAFDALSGEIHASVLTAMSGDSAYYRQAALDRLAVAGGTGGTVLWGEAYGNDGHDAGDGNAARLNHSLVGFLAGIDTAVSANWRVGGLVAYGRSKFDVGAGRDSSGHADKLTLGVYAGGEWGALRLRLGGSYGRDSLSVRRTVAFEGFADSLSSRYHGHTLQAFGELGYVLGGAGGTVEPFAGLAYVDAHANAFAERGGDAALTGKAASEDSTLSTLGLRGHLPLSAGSLPVTLDATLGWRHLFGSRTPWIDTAFAAGGPEMAIGGAPLARDAATVDAGLTFRLGGQASLSLAYTGQFGGGASSNGGRAQLRIGF